MTQNVGYFSENPINLNKHTSRLEKVCNNKKLRQESCTKLKKLKKKWSVTNKASNITLIYIYRKYYIYFLFLLKLGITEQLFLLRNILKVLFW